MKITCLMLGVQCSEIYGYWIIIDNFTITSCGIHWLNSAEGCLLKEDMGISWDAYRKEL